MKKLVTLVLYAAVTSSTSHAWAANVQSAAPPLASARPAEAWYGWQIRIADGGAAAAGPAIAAGSPQVGVDVFAGAYLFGGPILHWSRGHVVTGFGALALRLFVPALGLAIKEIATTRPTPGNVGQTTRRSSTS